MKNNDQKKNNEYLCKYCDKSFSRSNNYAKHLNHCPMKDNLVIKLQNELQQYKAKFELATIQLEEKDKQIEYLKEDKEEYKELFKNEQKDYKNIVNTAGNAVMSTMKYIMVNYADAPNIKKLDTSIPKMLTYDKEYDEDNEEDPENYLATTVLHKFKHKTLHQYLGNFIVNQYKTDNPEDQSIWNTDVPRLSYLVKDILKDRSKWQKDKNGLHVTKVLINPLLVRIRNVLQEYTVQEADKVASMEYSKDMLIVCENLRIANLIITEINDKRLHRNINRYIAPYFSVNK